MKFIFNTQTKWDEPPRARHQLAKALAPKHEIIFVSANKIGQPKIESEIVDDGIKLYQPSFPINHKIVFRIPILNEIYQNWLFKSLSLESNIIVINFVPTATQIFKYYKNIIYYANDNFLDKVRSGNLLISIYYRITQRIVAQRSLICIGVSKFIVNSLKKYNKDSYKILTATDNDLIQSHNTAMFHNTEKINITYVGWMKKINMDWVIELSKKINYSISLIGPFRKHHEEKLSHHNNIKLLGPLSGQALKEYLEKTDVFIAPYIIGLDTEYVYEMPNKFWLYIGSGKPIVTCQIKKILQLPAGFVYQAKNKSDFIKQIDRAYKEDSNETRKQRMEFIKKNTWNNRAEEIVNIINSLNKKGNL